MRAKRSVSPALPLRLEPNLDEHEDSLGSLDGPAPCVDLAQQSRAHSKADLSAARARSASLLFHYRFCLRALRFHVINDIVKKRAEQEIAALPGSNQLTFTGDQHG
jgi:hypothetical protein